MRQMLQEDDALAAESTSEDDKDGTRDKGWAWTSRLDRFADLLWLIFILSRVEFLGFLCMMRDFTFAFAEFFRGARRRIRGLFRFR